MLDAHHLFRMSLDSNVKGLVEDGGDGPLDAKISNHSKYARWGGLAATLGALDDIVTARQEDARIGDLLDKLDLLDAAEHSYDGLVNAVRTCAFTMEEINKLNSPVLDGLWRAIAGQIPHPEATIRWNLPGTMHSLFMRTVHPRPYPAAVEYLLDRGADLHENEDEPLRCAAEHGWDSVLTILLARGANVHALDDFALIKAAARGHVEVVSLLLQHVNAQPRAAIASFAGIGRALDAALRRPGTQIISMLIEQSVKQYVDFSPLLPRAAMETEPEVLDMLLRAGADINHGNSAAFRTVVSFDRVNMARALLERGSLVPSSSVWCSARFGYVSILELILDNADSTGVPIDLPTLEAALVRAASDNHVEYMLVLFKRTAVTASADRDAALIEAAQSGSLEAATLLLDRGADVHARSEMPLQRAQSCKHVRMVELLISRGADPSLIRRILT